MNAPAPAPDLQTPVRFVKGVGEARAAQLARMGVATVEDLLWTFPHRYEDRRQFVRVADLSGDEAVTLSGEVKACGWVGPRYGRAFFEARLDDGSGLLVCRWYGARYLEKQIKIGDRLVVYGKPVRQKGAWTLPHPDVEPVERGGDASIHMHRIVPVYPLTEDLSQRIMRRMVAEALARYLDAVPEFLPPETLKRFGFADMKSALQQAHFPDDLAAAERARHRFAFEEFLCMQLVLVSRKLRHERLTVGTAHAVPGRLAARFVASLPFSFTASQVRAAAEIRADLCAPRPMHRLLQGDVGSGKTVVAVHALMDVVEAGAQAAIMVPTEVLAAQHVRRLAPYLDAFAVRWGLLTGDVQGKAREELLAGIASGEVQVVVGTHALIQEGVAMKRLGLIVIDEQHKFGVVQRGQLYEKGGHPDVLVMTATPIPRTLAMTVYGDLDVSTLREVPAGRGKVVTRVLRRKLLPKAYGFMREQVEKGRQCYVVYPLVEESEKVDLRAAGAMYERLSRDLFAGLRVGLLHGQMPSAEKQETMLRFQQGQIDILVATTVIEVGVDVPNATVMLVEHAERYGLAQLHQLRGRIGRGAHTSYCLLEGDPATVEAWKRLKVMEATTDGFRIAEEDLEIRGMGNLLGREQSGWPPLRVGHPVRDVGWLQEARAEATRLLEKDPALRDPPHEALRRTLRARYRSVTDFAAIG